jgi:serine phosphatase RsbU (regulator of sigma subunit)
MYSSAKAILSPGSVLLLHTDGLSEARHQGQQYGHEALPAAVRQLHRRASLAGEARRLVEEARAFSGDRLLDDTVVVLLRLCPEGDPPL